MYGGLFKQTYGWYIEQSRLRCGVVQFGGIVAPELCPPGVASLINKHSTLMERRNYLVDQWRREHDAYEPMPVSDEITEIDRESPKLKRQIDKFFEIEARQELGFRKVGEAWVSETILAQLISRIYPTHELVRNYRPDWLEGLELDVYLPFHQLGFEYQGQQHYFPLKVWGGDNALRKTQERDARKRQLCASQGVRLIEISFREPLTLDHIRERIVRPNG